MIVQFTVANYKLFHKKATLSLTASTHRTHGMLSIHTSVVPGFKQHLLRSAVVYGANASGKSKLLEALDFMRMFTISSSKDGQNGDRIPVEPFRLIANASIEPSEFEVVFFHKGCRYRYGFEVVETCVESEWLYVKSKTREVEIFYREGESIDIHAQRFTKGKMIVREGLLRNNALLLSVAAQFNDPVCSGVIDWFQQMEIIRDLNSRSFRENTINKIKTNTGKEAFLVYLAKADMGISDLDVLPLEKGKYIRKPSPEVMTVRKTYSDSGKEERTVFSLNDDESEGTKKYIYLLGPIFDVLERGAVLLVDELDAKLHPYLLEFVVSLFHNSKTNPNSAQLIFNTHNTSILHQSLFRPDQVWFTEKNSRGEARLYSLADFRLSEGADYADRYLQGKFGAIPCLTDL